MKDMNKVILIGRLGADPVQRETKSGAHVVKFSLATSHRKKEATDGELTDETQWHRIVAWGKQGETCAQYLKKGHSVCVEGSIRSRKFQGKDGSQRMAFEVHAQDVNFLGRGAKPAEVQATPISECQH